MNEITREVYLLMMGLKDISQLDSAGLYNRIKDKHWYDASIYKERNEFVRRYFNNKQDGFDFYLE